jgi:nucleoside-diphosphate-sugar epimerase
MEKTAFVTGGTGFVGTNLLLELAHQGWAITALHRPGADTGRVAGLDINWVEGDITEIDSLRRAMPEGVGAVFHVAADISIWSRHNERQTRTNVGGTRNMVEVALEKGAARFVHVSSIAVWGLASGSIDETSPKLGQVSSVNYHRTKFAAEEIVREAVPRGLDAVMVNPPNIMGPYDVAGWARLIRLVHAGKLPGAPDGNSSFCDVREVAKALVRAAEVGHTGENYLLGGVDASYLEAVQVIGDVTGKRTPRRAMPGWLLALVGRIYVLIAAITGREPQATPEGIAMVRRRQSFDCSKAQAELGLRIVSLRAMIEDSYRWLADNDRLSI